MSLPETIDLVRPSIVQFSVRNPQTGDSQTFGSGFIIDEAGHVATAAHVVEDANQMVQRGFEVTLGLAYPNLDNGNLTMVNNFYHLRATVLEMDTDHDVALLKMDPNPFENPPISLIQIGDEPGIVPLYKKCSIAAARPRDGESIAVSGYPLNSVTLVTTAGYLASAWETQVSDVSDGSRLRDSLDVYLADISVNPGNSGGPVYRVADGTVIGVCTAYRFAPLLYADKKGGQVTLEERPVGINAGLCVVSPIRHITHLLEQLESQS